MVFHILLCFSLRVQVSEECVEIANQIAQSENPAPSFDAPTVEELKEGLQRQRIRNIVASRYSRDVL